MKAFIFIFISISISVSIHALLSDFMGCLVCFVNLGPMSLDC